MRSGEVYTGQDHAAGLVIDDFFSVAVVTERWPTFNQALPVEDQKVSRAVNDLLSAKKTYQADRVHPWL